MNNVVILCFTLAVCLIVLAIFYYTPYFSKKQIKKGKFDLLQFINLFFMPVLIMPIAFFLQEIIRENPLNPVIILPGYISQLIFLILIYFLILGNGIHSVSVVLSKHMKDLQEHKVWKVNEFFHNAFSHGMMTISSMLISLSYVVMEINRPAPVPLNNVEIALLIFSGIVSGGILGMACIEGSIPKTMLVILSGLSLAVPLIFFRFSLDFRLFPLSVFTETLYLSSVAAIVLYRYKTKGFEEIVPQYFFD